jgi:diamine N-acetyltransferase
MRSPCLHTHHVVGLAVVRFDTPCPDHPDLAVELQTLYVQEHFLGHGVGSLLLAAAEALARSRANSRLWLTVNATNSGAIAFYDRKGYVKVGTAYFVLGTERYENHVLAQRERTPIEAGGATLACMRQAARGLPAP